MSLGTLPEWLLVALVWAILTEVAPGAAAVFVLGASVTAILGMVCTIVMWFFH